ncbi:hypothetical protein GGF31_002773 [Allomyces arbusculus]|nr:hypothetical protein GGF31_002773 [Allomyces arbusculus]
MVANPDGTRALMQLARASPIFYAPALRWAIRIAPIRFVSMASPSVATCMIENCCYLDPGRVLIGRIGQLELPVAVVPRLYLIIDVAWQPNPDLMRPDLQESTNIQIQVPCSTVPIPFQHVHQFRARSKWPTVPPFVACLSLLWTSKGRSLPCGLSDATVALPLSLVRLHLRIAPNPRLNVILAEKLVLCCSLITLVLDYSDQDDVLDMNAVFGSFLCKLPLRLQSLTIHVSFSQEGDDDDEEIRENVDINGAISAIQLPSQLTHLLREMHLTSAGVTMLARIAFPQFAHLAHLDLSSNYAIRDSAMTTFAPALGQLAQLRTLDLSSTNLTTNGIAVLAAGALSFLAALRSLKLRYLWDVTSVVDLAKGLPVNVQRVEMCGCRVRNWQPLLDAPVGRRGRTVEGGRAADPVEWRIERVDGIEGDGHCHARQRVTSRRI